jgi:hypothetical protein
MHKSATKCNETICKWCKNKHGASKIIDTFETYHQANLNDLEVPENEIFESAAEKQYIEGFHILYGTLSGCSL